MLISVCVFVSLCLSGSLSFQQMIQSGTELLRCPGFVRRKQSYLLFAHSLNPSLPLQFGFDFTVHRNSINITSVLVFVSDGTLATSKNVTVFDRANDTALFRVDFNAGATTSQPGFASRPAAVVLRPGVYSILVDWNGNVDACTRGVPGTDETVVRTTAAIAGLLTSATRSRFTTVSASPGDSLGVTFAFDVIANQPPPPLLVATDFVDCEAVACAGLPTGEYSVQGRRTFCDNDEAGGGWTRIWRLNDSSCESNGWTSDRNVRVSGVDPVGCRRRRLGCSPSKDITMTSNWEK
jgi:hypothetical protein